MTKLVCRLLDANDRLLGWCAHVASMRGDGCLRATWHVTLTVDEDGTADALSTHWADMNVETRVPMGGLPVKRGQVLTIFPMGAPMVDVGGMPKKRLPPVSTKLAADIAVPVGQLGASGAA